ncbi:hypothetical protein OIU85_025476 [Salix viminalis]|uniref:Uncharacterized protein n=1 Tax=Salix viminalis TaxID=40686 RepID=A0A9Q0TLQ7_SALVM|nr:hypothetical protein OIU85_025476 [Salix viminalis]
MRLHRSGDLRKADNSSVEFFGMGLTSDFNPTEIAAFLAFDTGGSRVRLLIHRYSMQNSQRSSLLFLPNSVNRGVISEMARLSCNFLFIILVVFPVPWMELRAEIRTRPVWKTTHIPRSLLIILKPNRIDR